ncbi:MAG TPA: class I SAM-dependent methyltransferase [Gaiellaceae bacterium]|nr:class I SAM-dependent methyltransferase [Gaiellaceae bacterium]
MRRPAESPGRESAYLPALTRVLRRLLDEKQPPPSEVEGFFDDQAERWPDLYLDDPRFRRRFGLVTSMLRSELTGRDPGFALDAGCASGVFSAYLAEFGWTVEAVDSSARMLDRAEGYLDERLGPRRHAVSLWKLGIEDLPFPSESFDVVLCLSTLEYVEDDAAALRRLAQLLKAGGLLVISVPNRRSVVRLVERTLRGLRAALGRGAPPEAAYLALQRHQYAPEHVDAFLSDLGLFNRRKRYWSVGFSGPGLLVRLFERAWWAGMYGAVYVKSASV